MGAKLLGMRTERRSRQLRGGGTRNWMKLNERGGGEYELASRGYGSRRNDGRKSQQCVDLSKLYIVLCRCIHLCIYGVDKKKFNGE